MPMQKPYKFDNFSKLPRNLIPASLEVVKFSGAYIKLESQEDKFDWAAFKDSVDSYPGDDLIIDKFKSTTISRNGSTVAIMAEEVAKFLAHAVNASFYQNELTAIIQDTYANLKVKSSDGFLDFSKSGTGQNSCWEYRFQFAFPNQDIPNYFYSVVTTIKLKANLSNESDWWALDSSSTKDFSATVDAMELIVDSGFRSPK